MTTLFGFDAITSREWCDTREPVVLTREKLIAAASALESCGSDDLVFFVHPNAWHDMCRASWWGRRHGPERPEQRRKRVARERKAMTARAVKASRDEARWR